MLQIRQNSLFTTLAALGGLLFAIGEKTHADDNVYMFNTLPVQESSLASFLPIMRHNAQESRQEAGNISFDVFRKETGEPTIYLFEQWQSAAALEAHMKTAHLEGVIDAAGNAMTPGSAEKSVRLTKLTEGEEPNSVPDGTRNVIVTLYAKPEQREALKQALLDVVAPSRGAEGNLRYDVYQDKDNPNAFVVFERWVSVAYHEKHLEQSYNKPLVNVLNTALAEPIEASRLLLVDAS